MSKIFTITHGLENMGSIKTGGQGSVYKAKRTGDIVTAIKILPTPIYSESDEDKNFVSFQNEVNKLRRVNAHPNANVVSILGSGVTDSGNFPYIEMEYIEGPDLGELLKPPNEPVFIIDEVIKVANHLSYALEHCHKADVKHGDIKSNNVKFNIHTGNYILLDFGLSLLTDEERRTSLRHAGAIEFMAPEQHDGDLLFQSDIYSLGIILYELLAGSVPFVLKDSSENARNSVMTAQLELPPPDLLTMRKENIARSGLDKKKEMEVPQWLLNTIYRCIEKKPTLRFANGMELHDHIKHSQAIISPKSEVTTEDVDLLRQENERLKKENRQLYTLVRTGKQPAGNSRGYAKKRPSTISRFLSLKNIILLFLAVGTIGVVGYLFFQNSRQKTNIVPAAKIDTIANSRLTAAREDLDNGRTREALQTYNSLASSEIPEALYHAGNLALKNQNPAIDCNTALTYLTKAAGKNYPPAKRTLGFLYSSEAPVLEQNNYGRCKLERNIFKGSNLLMEAMLLGDAVAAKLLNDLNARIQEKKIAAKYEDIYKNPE